MILIASANYLRTCQFEPYVLQVQVIVDSYSIKLLLKVHLHTTSLLYYCTVHIAHVCTLYSTGCCAFRNDESLSGYDELREHSKSVRSAFRILKCTVPVYEATRHAASRATDCIFYF